MLQQLQLQFLVLLLQIININKNNEISRPSETKTSNKLTLKTVDNFENFYEIAKEYTKTTIIMREI